MAITGRHVLPPALSAVVVAILLHFTPQFEGARNTAYFDRIGQVATACFGHTGAGIKVGQSFSDEQCAGFLTEDLKSAIDGVAACVHRDDLDPYVWAGITDLAYNVGVPKVCASTLVARLNAGDAAPCDEFLRWIKAGGKDCTKASSDCGGIVERRRGERAMCEHVVLEAKD